MIQRYFEVGLTFKKRYRCTCGKVVVKQKRFYQTLNPFNLGEDGRQKGQHQILNECRSEADAWSSRNDGCTHVVIPAAQPAQKQGEPK